jgi:hypothetical protein
VLLALSEELLSVGFDISGFGTALPNATALSWQTERRCDGCCHHSTEAYLGGDDQLRTECHVVIARIAVAARLRHDRRSKSPRRLACF